MASTSTSKRRFVKAIGGLALVGAASLALPSSAFAASNASAVVGCAGASGTATATFTFRITENFVSSLWANVVGVGETARVNYATPGQDPPGTTSWPFNYTVGSATLELAPGTYSWYWWDTTNLAPPDNGPNGPHGQGGVINGPANVLVVESCPVETTAPTTTVVAETTTTAPVPTTATAATTTTVVPGVPTTAPAATTTTAAAVPPTAQASTTAVVQTTAAASANTLPATGSNNTPLIGMGVAFLLVGGIATASTHRRRPVAR